MSSKKGKILLILYCFIVAFVILLFTTKNSFLYPFNDWVDENAFFTVGKAMVRGIVPYRDLFEQKGPLLYFIFGLASLISYKSFIGVFLIEVNAWTIALYYVYKICRIFLSNKSSLLIIPIFTVLITTTKAFVHGGSAEEFLLPLFMITLYYFIKHFKVRELTKKEMFINGIVAGLVLLTKFNLLGFWIGFTFSIFIDYLLKKDYKKAISYSFILLSGMLIPFIISLIYFGLNNGIKEYIDVYFITNLTAYSSKTTFLNRVAVALSGGVTQILLNYWHFLIFMILIILSIIKNSNYKLKILLFISFIIALFFIFYGLSFYPYYILFILYFSLLGLITIFNYLDKVINNLKIKNYRIILGIVLVLCIFCSYNFANYKEFRKVNKEDLFQYKFSEIIKTDENATLVNIAFLDAGVYTLSGIIPSTYYFEEQNFKYSVYPYNIDALNEYIENKQVTYLVYFNRKDIALNQRYSKALENYNLISKETQKFEGKMYNAYLFKVKDDV